MSLMPETLVTSAEIDGKNHIVLSVNVDAFTPGEYVEVSGYATQTTPETQVNGGFATFSEIQEIEITKPDNTAELEVKAKLTREFQQGLDVTVVVRVAKVWVTVLSEDKPGISPQKAGQGWAWGQVKGVGGPDEYSSARGSAGQTAG
jgi:hypothetical protein